LNAAQNEWVERGEIAVRQMERMTQDLFNLSKIESGTLEIARERVDLKSELEQIYQVGQSLPWSDTVEFELDLPTALPEVDVDSVRLQQVLMNLISNAHKFTVQGSVRLYATDSDPNVVQIGVQDTGEGIPPEAQSSVFERFRQFDSNAVRRNAGAGLGLAICKELVERHGGRIWVDSAPGQGSTFSFTLPVV
jgi:signal transduction histidine kinase